MSVLHTTTATTTASPRIPASLVPFRDAGVLEAADLQVALGLMRIGGCSNDSPAALAAAMCVRALRHGSICVDLSADPLTWVADGLDEGGSEADPGQVNAGLEWPSPDEWLDSLRGHPLVALDADPDQRPLRLVGSLLYLHRYWEDEQLIRKHLVSRSTARPIDPAGLRDALSVEFPDEGPDQQRLGAAVALTSGLSLIAGGPGTGKTRTVAHMLGALFTLMPDAEVALVAPTGKAAARMKEAVADAVERMSDEIDPATKQKVTDVPSSTIHRLLGGSWKGGGNRFDHNRNKPLPHDVVVVDETSMVPLQLMARLMEAMRPDARLVLVGDPHQLASVEAGAVLGDLVSVPPSITDETVLNLVGEAVPVDAATFSGGAVTLLKNHRFGGSIAALADAVRGGDVEETMAILEAGTDDVEFIAIPDGTDPRSAAETHLRQWLAASAARMAAFAKDGEAGAALDELEKHRLLCAHRQGMYGANHWSAVIQEWSRGPRANSGSQWYPGQPLIVNENSSGLGVYNGDTGVVIQAADGLRAAFRTGGEDLLIHPSRLTNVSTVYAMTIHRSQGSQFDHVTVLLPRAASPLLTRELLYTAITRAKSAVRIIGSEEALRGALDRQVRRSSGLRSGW